MTTISLAVSKLVHSPRNVRQPSPDDDTTDLEVSIVEFGLLNPLTAHPMPRGKHGVFAGGRRLLALQRLIERKQLPKDHTVDVTVRDESDITLTEMSFAENAVRLALPAVTEFQTYSRLIDEGADITAVAHRYQVTELHVRQRMRLGKLHPAILEALAADRLTLDIAKAYAATEDQELQKRIFDQRPTHPYEIRAAMKRDLVNAGVDRMLALIGMDAYAAAGGRAEEDLFTPGEARVLDVEILRGLYDAKLIAQRDLLSLPVNVTLQFGGEGLGARVEIIDEPTDEQRERMRAIEPRMDEIDQRIDQIAEWDHDAPMPRLVALAGDNQDEVDRLHAERRRLEDEVEGIINGYGWPDGPLIASAAAEGGRLVIASFHRPLGWKPDAVTTSLPSDAAPVRAAAPAAPKSGPVSTPAAKTSPEPTAAPQKPVINGFRSDRLGYSGVYRQPEDVAREQYGLTKDAVEAMRSHQRQTLQAAMLSTPIAEKLAHTFLIFVLARDMLRERHADEYKLDQDGKLGVGRVPPREHDPHQVRADLSAQPAASIVGDALGRLQASDWMREPDVDTAFRRFSTSPHIDQQRAAACVAAAMLNRSLGIPGFRVPIHDTIAEFLTVERDIRDYWTPDAAYFARLPKNQKLEAVRFVDAGVAKRIANLGTDDLTEAAAMIMSGTLAAASKYGLSREACDRAAGWVPAYLSFAQPDEPDDPEDEVADADEQVAA